ncbi:MAG: tyrosine-type recombinase/integrase, partial [Alphaproteobacteria bacterium]|nr:tyrosine-type recombinase/integrase [Alphaproteobacteria bacterium]
QTARQGTWLEFTQSKTGQPHTAYLCKTAQKILDDVSPHSAMTLIAKPNGTPWALEGIKTSFPRYIARLVAAGMMPPGMTFHGLRHTGATILAEAGHPDWEIGHFLGHAPRTVSGHYGRHADRRGMIRAMTETIETRILSADRAILALNAV